MTKKELMENYTMEQLADMVVESYDVKETVKVTVRGIPRKYHKEELSRIIAAYDDIKDCKENEGKHLHSEEYLKIISLNNEVTKLQSLVEKYRKSFEDAKGERDKRISEYENRIREMESRTFSDFLPEEPIDVASVLINSVDECREVPEGLVFYKKHFNLSELRQIAEHLIVYCSAVCDE